MKKEVICVFCEKVKSITAVREDETIFKESDGDDIFDISEYICEQCLKKLKEALLRIP